MYGLVTSAYTLIHAADGCYISDIMLYTYFERYLAVVCRVPGAILALSGRVEQ